MTGPGPRVTLRIDRIIADRPGIDRAALAAALHAQITARLAAGGVAALGRGGARAAQAARLPLGSGPVAARLAQTVLDSAAGRGNGGTG